MPRSVSTVISPQIAGPPRSFQPSPHVPKFGSPGCGTASEAPHQLAGLDVEGLRIAGRPDERVLAFRAAEDREVLVDRGRRRHREAAAAEAATAAGPPRPPCPPARRPPAGPRHRGRDALVGVGRSPRPAVAEAAGRDARRRRPCCRSSRSACRSPDRAPTACRRRRRAAAAPPRCRPASTPPSAPSDRAPASRSARVPCRSRARARPRRRSAA